VPIVVEGEMHTVSGSAAAGVYYFANCSEDPQMSVLSVEQDAASVRLVVAEAGKSLYSLPAAVDLGIRLVALLGGTEHPLWRMH
jgi:hypothetical protein